MPIGRRKFLKSASMTTLSAGFALGSAGLLFGQRTRDEASPLRKVGPRLPIQNQPVDNGFGFPIPIEAQQEGLFYFRPATFTPYVGDIFQVPNARGELIELQLTRVSQYKMKSATKISTRKVQQPESFSLSFSAMERLPQFTSIHKMSHPALGEFDLFLTNHETEDGIYTNEAVFNHLRWDTPRIAQYSAQLQDVIEY